MRSNFTSNTSGNCKRLSKENDDKESCQSCTVHNLAVCAPLHKDELAQYGVLNHHEHYPAGTIIFEEGKPREKMYTLISGTIRLLKTLNDGRRCITGFVFPGNFLGLTDTGKHTLTAEAITSVTLCAFEREDIDILFHDHPGIRDRFLEMARAALLRSYESQLILSRLSPVERLARFLYDLMKRMEGSHFNVSPLNLSMNRTDIADHLGLTIETVSRCFSKLKAQGAIHLISINKVEILNRELLKKLAAITDEID